MKEQVIAELRQQFEQQVEDAVTPYQWFIPVGVAFILLGIFAAIMRLFSWLPTLILRAILAILTACHVTSVVTGDERSKKANYRPAGHIAHSSELCGHSHNRTLDLESGSRLLEYCLAARLFDKNLHYFFAAHHLHLQFTHSLDHLV